MLVAIEAGEKNVSLTTLDLIAEALGVAFST
jgi:transcriptional regulator with XRE-family HTH domain